MQTETDTLAERVDSLLQASRGPLLSTASTPAAIAELMARIEALETALREIADDAGAHSQADGPSARKG